MGASPARATSDGILLDLRVSPGAGRTAVAGVESDAMGVLRLRLRVAAPPVDGAANAAVLAFLAKAFGRPKRACALTQGHKNRSKTVKIDGAPADLLATAAALTGGDAA